MATAHLSIKTGRVGKAGPHADYISRSGRYAWYAEKGETLEASATGNMPGWAREDPSVFWQAADAHERVNGAAYREHEIALPRELTPEQRRALVEEWVQQELGERHAYQWAIHTPQAADGLTQPHVHLMFSTREQDGIQRDPEQFFRRYNPKNPEKGGCRKAQSGRDLAIVREETKALRARWETSCNRALERAGHDERIDMRSYAERGLNVVPERHYGPDGWRAGGMGEVLEFRQARKELHKAQEIVDREMPGVLVSLEEARQRAEQQQQELAEALRVSKTAQRVKGVQGQRFDVGDPRQATISGALGGHVRIVGNEIHADPQRSTAFRLGGDDAEILERLRASGIPPAVVVAEVQRGSLTTILKHRPVGQVEQGNLVQAVDRAAGRRLERVPAIVPARAVILEASGREINLERILGQDIKRGMER